MSFSDKLKASAAKAADVAQKAAHAATEKAGEMADKHGDKVAAGAGSLAAKAGAAVDKKTGGKYAEQIAKAQGAVESGVAKGAGKLAEQSSPAAKAKHATTSGTATPVAGEHQAEVTTEDRSF